MLFGARCRLPGRLGHLLALLFATCHGDDPILASVQVALLEHLLNLVLGLTKLREIISGGDDLLLHLFEASHPGSNLSLTLLLHKLFLLDLGPGPPSIGRCLHHVARLAFGDYTQ